MLQFMGSPSVTRWASASDFSSFPLVHLHESGLVLRFCLFCFSPVLSDCGRRLLERAVREPPVRSKAWVLSTDEAAALASEGLRGAVGTPGGPSPLGQVQRLWGQKRHQGYNRTKMKAEGSCFSPSLSTLDFSLAVGVYGQSWSLWRI